MMNRLPVLTAAWLWACNAAIGAPVPATDVPLTWELLPQAAVDSAGIYLRQVLTAHPTGNLPNARLAPAPLWGQTASLSRSQILALLTTAAPELHCTNWSGAERVRVVRRSRQLAETELKEALTVKLQDEPVKDRGELELRLSRPWPTVAIPDEPFALKILDLPATGVSPNFIVRFELWAGEERLGNWQLAVQAKVWSEVPVAHSAIRRGQILSDAEVTLERRDVLTLRQPLSAEAVKDPSLEVIENVPAGAPLLARTVRVRPLVQRGTLVDALVQDGALNISLKVEALEDGVRGQLIRVRNPKSRREFAGKVQNEQTILIAM